MRRGANWVPWLPGAYRVRHRYLSPQAAPLFASLQPTLSLRAFAPVAVFLLWLAMMPRLLRQRRVPDGLVPGLAELLTFSAIPLWLLLAGSAAVGMAANPSHRTQLLRALLVMTGVAEAVFLGLYLWSGYDLFASLTAAIGRDAAQMGTGHESFSRFLLVGLANLGAFLIGIGAATVVVWGRAIARALRVGQRKGVWDLFVLCPAVGIITLAWSTLYTLEVERIWLFLVPFAVIPSAAYLVRRFPGARLFPALAGVAAALFAQTLVLEMLLYTYW